jgi:hypothetical protein
MLMPWLPNLVRLLIHPSLLSSIPHPHAHAVVAKPGAPSHSSIPAVIHLHPSTILMPWLAFLQQTAACASI